MKRCLLCAACAVSLAAVTSLEGSAAGRLSRGPQGEVYEQSFDVNLFELPEDAAVLVVVEGTYDTECKVHAYVKTEEGWTKQFQTDGWLGYGGLSNNRTAGDETTPIGLFRMNTPFGQEEPQEGFPENYIRVDEGYVWDEETNKLRQDLTKSGELVGTAAYLPQYVYVLDMGYNKEAIRYKGSALFIHCKEENEDGTMGCVAVEKERMAELMRLYGTYGDGRCYIALAPFGTFDKVYDSYGVNHGLSPDGTFPVRWTGGPGMAAGPGAQPGPYVR